MFPGPVFAVELLTIARRSRYYALRTLYGMLLMLVIWLSYREFMDSHGEGQVLFAPNEMSIFAKRSFMYFAVAQGLVVLAITPALVGGTIAGEKQRKTLHYLLASELTSSEIVFGKLLARLLMIFVYILAGVPLLFMMRLFGGIDSSLIFLDLGVTVSGTIFLASMSIFFSAIMRQARSAIKASYLSLCAIALLPFFGPLVHIVSYGNALWVADLIDWISPILSGSEIRDLMMGGIRFTPIARMLTAQAVYSTLFLLYSSLRLRAIAANQTNKPRVILRLDKRGRPSWRALPRPAISNNPMMWKERFTSRVGGWAKMLGLVHNLFWATLIGCFTFEYARTAVLELMRVGFFNPAGNSSNREEFIGIIKNISPFIAGFWVLGTATTAAASIASEREDDTWLSLIATDLEGKEILRAKMIGSILRFRWLGLMLLIVWGIGLVAGAIHPLSFLIATLELMVFLSFAAALGVRFSLKASSTSRALALTLGVLVFMNGGYLLCCIPIPAFQVTTSFFGVMPWVLNHALFSSDTPTQYDAFVQSPFASRVGYSDHWAFIPTMLSLGMYASLTAVLTWRSFAMFDNVVDRPRTAE